jgi:hypothetical protein
MKAAHAAIGTVRLNRLVSPSAQLPETFTTPRPAAGTEQQPGPSASAPAVSDNSPEEAPPAVNDVLRSPGAPLDTATRSLMEMRLGADFSRVRVHTDARAAASARRINALAYTHGSSIVFDSARYLPHNQQRRNVLAEELVHTMQQGATTEPPSSNERLSIESRDSPAEREARIIAQASGPAFSKAPTHVPSAMPGRAPALARSARHLPVTPWTPTRPVTIATAGDGETPAQRPRVARSDRRRVARFAVALTTQDED